MAVGNRRELLALALTAGMMVIFVGRLAGVLSAPTSTPMDFVYRAAERRDGPASLGSRPSPGKIALRLAFAGDVMQHHGQAGDDFDACYRQVGPLLAGCDLAAANLEFPVDPTRPVGPPDGAVRFNGSPAHVAALARAGVRVLSTANNHCFDQGADGLARTLQVIRSAGLTPVGNLAGPANDQPAIVERNGFRVGFFAYTFRPNSYADERGVVRYWKPDWPVHALVFEDWSAEYRAEGLAMAARHASAAREAGVDFLVALVHWGREWQFQPNRDQRVAGHDLIDQGFDLIVGSHAHVLNPVEVYRGRVIAWSLGNAISDFRPVEARTGAVLQVDLAPPEPGPGRLEVADFRAVPILTEGTNHRVRPVRAAGADDRAARDLARKVLGAACVFREEATSARPGGGHSRTP